MMERTTFRAWRSLNRYSRQLIDSNFLSKDSQLNHFVATDFVTLEYSNQMLDSTAHHLLLELAHELQLHTKIQGLMTGAVLNLSQNCPALHTALRHPNASDKIFVEGNNIIPSIMEARRRMDEISVCLRNQQWLGYSGKPIKDIVNIGMGGSDLGPKFCYYALKPYATRALNFHFISDCDPYSFSDVTENLNPETTIFIISSKSFTTIETLYNFEKAVCWIGKDNATQHFIAITAHESYAKSYGIQYVLPLWEWVGGRYSATSAINLITVIAIGPENFQQFLMGAHQMDMHFLDAPYAENLPIILALLCIWNVNFLNIHDLIMLIYSKPLKHLVSFVQQLEMESNGKSHDQNGRTVNYMTCPMVWGGLGNIAQHSYYQLMCQGTHSFSVDFLTVGADDNELIHQQFKATLKILSEGIDNPDSHQYIKGAVPINHISLKHLTPKSIGSLIALYEHKAFVQGVVWNLNPFDQPGVERVKRALINSSL